MAENGDEQPKKRATNWTQIVVSVAGAVVVGMQGVNFAEISHGNSSGEKRMEVLQQLLSISQDTKELLKNQNTVLENGVKELERDETSLKTQSEILTTLRDAIKERREQLKQDQ